MGKNKISLITTVLNEERNIFDFIKSINNQTILPDEVIIVDGGSIDNTPQLISKLYNQCKKLNINLIIKKGNRSVGRNIAIKNSKYDLIAVTDVGCTLDKNWIKNITSPFADLKIDVVSGFYKPTFKNIFQKCLSTYTSTMPDMINKEDFLPSSRSVAFRKSAWRSVKGYPENLDTCEDLVFDKKLKEKDSKFYFQQSAFVYWPQRKNIKEAFLQFLSYARGDGIARYFRPNTPFLYLRYLLGLFLVALSLVMKSIYLDIFIALCFLGYILWSVFKNYKYVKNRKAFIYLPMLQFSSDIAVLIGTTLGYIQGINIKNFFKKISNNKGILLLTFIYVLIISSGISWGIPNPNHPFNYHMDEWHFSQALRTFLKYGTGSFSGAASIPLYHIVSTLIFLFPFYLLKIVNPFLIKSSIDNIGMQHTLFEILRLHTLLYGVLSIAMIYLILKKFINFKPLLIVSFFVFNPIFLLLSGFYKYDITLIFWIITTIYFLLKFKDSQNKNDFIFAGVACGLALSTKFTAVPLFLGLIFSYFIFAKKYNFKIILFSVFSVAIIFILVGVPDMVLGKGSYFELLNSTLIQGPKADALFNFGLSPQGFLLFKEFPSMFGYFLILLFYSSIIYFVYVLANALIKKEILSYRIELFMLILSFLFLLSTILFGIDGGGNRALVLLPFIVLLSSLFLKNLWNKNNPSFKIFLVIIIVLGLVLQILQSYSWYLVKFSNDPRQTSSEWIIKNIPIKSTIGLENIPIYQMLPDVVLKEFYQKEYNSNSITRYSYKVISFKDNVFPKYIIITNDYNNVSYLNVSPKKDLINKIRNSNYKKIKNTEPNLYLYNLFSNKLYLIIANILPVPANISIYEKK